ncbi:MAG: pilus assembly protein, partial [Anaerolineae bacterium]|nr:pilus assembly protein [Anaerolineae bacterium]
MKKQKYVVGQGLLEFALILPILLLLMLGIMEYSRIFVLYVSLSNASREGVRYGMVNPKDYVGINTEVRDNVMLIPPDEVAVNVRYDHGPSSSEFIDPQYVSAGDRVIIELNYPVQALTGVMDPFISDNLVINLKNTRTIQSVRPQAAGTHLPAPTSTGAPTATATPETLPPTDTPEPGAPTPTRQATVTPTPTFTPTPTPQVQPIIIDEPVTEGETSITGTAEPGRAVTLRIIQTGLQRTVDVGTDGTFLYDGLPALVAGHTVIVQGYGSQDLAVVQGSGTGTPSPSPTPSTAFIVLDPSCTNDASTTITVYGYNWDSQAKDTYVYWDEDANAKCTLGSPVNGAFSCVFETFVTEGMTHIVRAEGWKNKVSMVCAAEATFVRPCAGDPTPTPTPVSRPDLKITGIQVTDAAPLGTYQTLHLAVGVMNDSAIDVASLFWLDLYVDPVSGTPLSQQASVDYVAINALSAGSTISLTMYVPDGFDATGDYTVQAMVDTWDQILETNEDNNVSALLPVQITVDNPVPTPTPTPAVIPGPPGSIQGSTYLNFRLQSNVSVYVYDADGRLWGSGRSDVNGNYFISNVPAGDYMVVGVLRLANVLYQGQ